MKRFPLYYPFRQSLSYLAHPALPISVTTSCIDLRSCRYLLCPRPPNADLRWRSSRPARPTHLHQSPSTQRTPGRMGNLHCTPFRRAPGGNSAPPLSLLHHQPSPRMTNQDEEVAAENLDRSQGAQIQQATGRRFKLCRNRINGTREEFVKHALVLMLVFFRALCLH
ncbi:uncharacterized protein [Triticum aestivum]|uniref:uncharacterized protein n=1 Tax=Triticum aestivum TaxID=4565 RepID=UPI001D022936|nr:uncharacterized protein LOC123096584 [Triticum aestivum]